MRFVNIKTVTATGLAISAVTVGAALAASAEGSAGGPKVSALTNGPATSVPSTVRAQLASRDAARRGVDVNNAHALSTPRGTWYLAPAQDGACLVADDGAMTCAPTTTINRVGLISLSFSRSVGHGDQLQPAGPAQVRGVAPDDVSSAKLLDQSGRVIAAAAVTGNAYSATLADGAAPVSLQFEHSSGSTSTMSFDGS